MAKAAALAKQAEAQQLEADAQRFKMEQERQRREHEKKIARIKRDMDEHMAEMRRKKEAENAAAKAEQQASIAKLRQIQMVGFIVLSCRECNICCVLWPLCSLGHTCAVARGVAGTATDLSKVLTSLLANAAARG